MATESVMEISDEVISVLLIKTHEGAAHHDEFDLVCIMSKPLQLLNTVFSLKVGVIPGSNSSHRGRLITCIGLS